MSSLGSGRDYIIISVSYILILIATSTSVYANPSTPPPPEFDRTIDLVLPNFPINGLILLGMYFAFLMKGDLVEPRGMLRHMVAFTLSVGVITFSGALIDTVAFLEDVLVIYLAAASLIACICTAVAYRYLRMSLVFSLLTGAVFFIVNLVAWAVIDDWFWTLVDYTVFFIMMFVIFIIFLVFEARWFHYIPPRDLKAWKVDQEGGQPSGVANHPIVDWISANRLALEALSFCLVLFVIIVYYTLNPIFVFSDY